MSEKSLRDPFEENINSGTIVGEGNGYFESDTVKEIETKNLAR